VNSQPTPTIEDLWQLVQKQAAEIAELRAGQDPQTRTAVSRVAPGGNKGKLSRARLLKVAAAGAVATTMAAGSELAGSAKPALADGNEGQTTFNARAGMPSPRTRPRRTTPAATGYRAHGQFRQQRRLRNQHRRWKGSLRVQQLRRSGGSRATAAAGLVSTGSAAPQPACMARAAAAGPSMVTGPATMGLSATPAPPTMAVFGNNLGGGRAWAGPVPGATELRERAPAVSAYMARSRARSQGYCLRACRARTTAPTRMALAFMGCTSAVGLAASLIAPAATASSLQAASRQSSDTPVTLSGGHCHQRRADEHGAGRRLGRPPGSEQRLQRQRIRSSGHACRWGLGRLLYQRERYRRLRQRRNRHRCAGEQHLGDGSTWQQHQRNRRVWVQHQRCGAVRVQLKQLCA
jgi:hypothetical protein